MSTDIRAALDAAEQHAAAEVWAGHPLAIILEALIKQTRAALAEPEVGEVGELVDTCAAALLQQQAAPAPVIGDRPSDDELYDLADEFAGDPVPAMRAALARWGRPAAPAAPLTDLAARLISESKPMDPEIAEALTPEARWDLYEGPAAPAAPEVGELVAWLEQYRDLMHPVGDSDDIVQFTRIVLLLSQPPAPAPAAVPVALDDRPWEREGWCDERGRCWFLSSRFLTWALELPPAALTRGVGRFHSLPAHAIPLPQGVEGG